MSSPDTIDARVRVVGNSDRWRCGMHWPHGVVTTRAVTLEQLASLEGDPMLDVQYAGKVQPPGKPHELSIDPAHVASLEAEIERLRQCARDAESKRQRDVQAAMRERDEAIAKVSAGASSLELQAAQRRHDAQVADLEASLGEQREALDSYVARYNELVAEHAALKASVAAKPEKKQR